MNKMKLTFTAFLVFVFVLAFTSSIKAQVSRTFVSTFGSDSNPCDHPIRPCRNIQAGITKVQVGGEVVVISSGSYQPFTVNKPITVAVAPGEHVGISVFSGHGAVINAGPTDSVTLHGLTFNWIGGSNNNGIEFNAGAVLHVEGCVINGFPGAGILSNAPSKLFIKDTTVKNGGNFSGIFVEAPSGTVTVSIERSRVEGLGATGIGILAGGNSRVTIRDTVSSGNGTGFQADPQTMSGIVEMNLENCVATNNGFAGIFADGSPGTSIIRVSNTTVTNNNIGLTFNPGGSILTRGNNTVEGNTNNGFFTGSFLAK
jgi:hypothetical protein